jgi:hypothetical protein
MEGDMLKFRKLVGLVAAVAAAAIWAAPAQAQATRTWVSGVGSDANPCSRTAPCKTFAGAYAQTAAGGEIDALDPGGYGTITIAKNLTIDGGGGQVASVLSSSSNAIVINGAGIIVTLKNLSINGTQTSGIGVDVSNAAQVNIINCDIFGATAYDIGFFPSVAGSQLYVKNSTIHGSSAYGVVIDPLFSSGNVALVVMDGVQIFQNAAFGLFAADLSKTQVTRSNISQNASGGVDSVSANSPTIVNLEETTVAGNGGVGLTASGTGSPRIRISNTMISDNAGASISGASNVFSFGNNRIVDNATDVAPGVTIPQE